LCFPCLLPREDPRDALFADGAASLDDLPHGAVVGTAALRRQAQILARRPDLNIVSIRGNVDTRLRKLAEGQVDATILAAAGLRRLGMADRITALLPTDQMLSAVAQGAIGISCRSGDDAALAALAPLHCDDTGDCVAAERALLAVLDGSCRTPIAALATLDTDGGLAFEALIARPDGTEVLRTGRAGNRADAPAIGQDAGAELKSHAGAGMLSW
jgi:hydroxymethylbilane synthase